MNLDPTRSTDRLLIELLKYSELVFVKKLMNNDRDWAWLPNKHQAGVYIPLEQRDGGFFPKMENKERQTGKAEIRESWLVTDWPQTGNFGKRTRLVNYRSKGEETHLTRLPKEAFSDLAPSSFLVIGRSALTARTPFTCLTVDATEDAAAILTDELQLPPDFQAVVRSPDRERRLAQDQMMAFADQLLTAWRDDTLQAFATIHAVMPDTATLAKMARDQYLSENGLVSLSPFQIERPGDAVRHISRVIELEIFRSFQRRRIAAELVMIVTGDKPDTPAGILSRIVQNIGTVDSLMLSASQQRRSRAGYSFEHHIEAMLIAGGIPFEKQVVIDAKKRPDFVLPSWSYLNDPTGNVHDGFILSAKTTLRERWKQVQREMGSMPLFLATVDETIAGNAIEDMAVMGITLVVPENLKAKNSTAAKAAEYRGHTNVLSFAELFQSELKGKRLLNWLS